MRNARVLLVLLAIPLAGAAGASEPAAPPSPPGLITLESLLREMIDRDAVARWPDPAYKCLHASSYDRRSKTPDDPAGWFANNDWSQFIRFEENKGRREWVLMEADGPGCIVRQWWGGKFPPKDAVLRFYLDGAEEPAIEGPPHGILAGGLLAPKPLSMEYAKAPAGSPGGMNLYLPIPYAKHCKVTYSEPSAKDPTKPPPNRWYNIEYRAYAAGTRVKTFTMADLKAASATLEDSCEQLRSKLPQIAGELVDLKRQSLESGKEISFDLPAGPAAIRKIIMTVRTDNPSWPDQVEEVWRSTVIRMTFDGQETVWCPVGDFSGSGVGLNSVNSWYRTVIFCGQIWSHWVMPYQKSARVTFVNLGKQKVDVYMRPIVGPWQWDSRSMHFHATWRQERDIPTRPYKDWNYVTLTGKGVYMGDTLALFNPVRDWWGEGDEKIWVDGESFPSHFGTGSEDYYGYSYGNPTVFQTPFCNQPRCDGPGNAGHTTNTRTRNLDAIPFEKSLKFDMEIWHWKDCKVNYAATTYWYALPGATSNRVPQPEEAVAPIPRLAESRANAVPPKP